MLAYKLLRVRKDGSLGPLFINRRLRIPVGTWLTAEDHPTKGYTRRPGWHAMLKPVAPHLSTKGRAWFQVDVDNDFDAYTRPKSQGGAWLVAKRIKVLGPVDGWHRL